VLTSDALQPVLTPDQQRELERLEVVIKAGWKTFLEVGEALAKVRDLELYKGRYGSFEDYWKLELGFSRSYAYNLIGSAEVMEQLSSIEDFEVKSLKEAQLRELISVPQEKRPAAWKRALELAGGKTLTAKIIRKAAVQFKSLKSGKPKSKQVVAPKKLNLVQALKLIVGAEKLAGKNKLLLAKLAALRNFLTDLAGE